MRSDRDVYVVAAGAIAHGIAHADEFARIGDGHVPELTRIERFSTEGCVCDRAFHATTELRDPERAADAVRQAQERFERRFGVRFDRDVELVTPSARFLFACCDQLEATFGSPGSLPEVMGERVGIFVGTCSGHVDDAGYAVAHAAPDPDNRSLRILHGTPFLGGTLLKAYLGWPPDSRVSVQVTTTACSASLDAIGRAAAAIRSGRIDHAIAGGMDAVTEPVLRGFDATRVLTTSPCRPFDRARRGFQLGEGAGLLALSAESIGSGDPVVEGMGTSVDGYHLTSPDPTGAGLERALVNAKLVAGGPVGGVIGHGTATPRNDEAELGAYAAHLPAATPVMSLKSTLGHTLGAAGVHGAILAVRALATGMLPGTRNLTSPLETPLIVAAEQVPLREPRVAVTAAAFGGHNVALLLAGCGHA